MTGAPLVFIAYAHDDRYWRDRVVEALRPLEEERLVEIWFDREGVEAGDDWSRAILAAIDRAAIAVLLVSPASLRDGGYLVREELPRLLDAHRDEKTLLLPLDVGRVEEPPTELAAVQAINRGRPLPALARDECDTILRELAEQVQRRAELLARRGGGGGWHAELLAGMPSLQRRRIRRFLDEYLGTSDKRIAFGGRAETIATLRQWIGHDDGPAVRFLIGQMGRGKSAVICRLLEAIATSAPAADASASPAAPPAIVFVPVSLRFETSGAATLLSAVDRLALLHGDHQPRDAGLELRRTMLADYLGRPLPSGRALLVILDGVDEADGGLDLGYLPRTLPAGTRVLISLRVTRGEAERIAEGLELARGTWRVDELLALGMAGVAEVLRREGLAGVADDVGRVQRLFEISEGDPLVMRFLIEDLRADGADEFFARVAAPGFQNGLRGVFARELERVAIEDDAATDAFLGVLACASGPLGRDDLVAVAPDELPRGGTIERVHRPLRRLVLRGGEVYTFAHPGLAEHVRDHRLGAVERKRWQRALVDHGRRTVAAVAAGEDVELSAYLLRSHGAHLALYDGTVDDRLGLVSDGWRRAWEGHDEGTSGFLRDVERAWIAVARASRSAVARGEGPRLAAIVRCALCPASVHSQASKLDPKLLEALLQRRIWSPAQALAHLRAGVALADDFSDRSLEEGLAVVDPHLDPGQTLEAMELAVAIADREHGALLAPWLARLPRALPARLDDVELMARALPRVWQRVEALVEIAKLVAAAHAPRAAEMRALAALLLTTEVPRPWGFLNLTTRLADELDEPARSQILAEACALAATVEPLGQRASYCAGLARVVTGDLRSQMAIVAARAGCTDESERAPDDALDLLPVVEDEVARRVIDEIIAAGRIDALAGWVARRWQPERVCVAHKWERLVHLLDEPEASRVLDAWIELMRTQWSASSSSSPLEDLVAMGQSARAITIVRESPDPRQRDTGLGYLAHLLPIEERVEVLERLVTDGRGSDWAIIRATEAVAAERLETTLALLRRCRDPVRAHALRYLPRHAQGEQRAPVAALLAEVAHDVDDASERLRLLELAHGMSGDDDLFRRLCDEIAALPARLDWLRRSTINDLADRSTPAQREALERLSPATDGRDEDVFMPGRADARLLRIGRAGIAAMARSDFRARSYLRLAELLAELGDDREARLAIEDALRASKEIADARDVCAAAAAVGPKPSTMTAIVERAKTVSDPAERFRALVALPQEGAAGEAARMAAVDAAEAALDVQYVSTRDFFLRFAPPERGAATATRLFDEVREQCRAAVRVLARLRTDEELDPLVDSGHVSERQVLDIQRLLGEIAWALSPAQAAEALDLIPWQWTGHALTLLRVLARGDETARARHAEIVPRVLEILRTRRGIKRGGALAVLAHHVPESERAAVIDEALAEARTEGDEHIRHDNRAAVLTTVAPLLDETHLDRVIPLALDTWRGSLAVGYFVSRLPEPRRGVFTDRLLDAVKGVDTHEVLLAGLAAHVPAAAIDRVVLAVERKARGYHAVLEIVPTLAPRCSEAQLVRLLDLSVDIHRHPSSRPNPSRQAIGAVGGELLTRSREHAPRMFDLVDDLVRAHARTRADLLETITALAPLLRALGGPDEMDAVAREILEISRWWP